MEEENRWIKEDERMVRERDFSHERCLGFGCI